MKKTKQLFSYLFFGILTTCVNYFTYMILLSCHIQWLEANSFAWLVAVIFAYYHNKKYVFKSHGSIKDEFISFFTLRFLSLIIENISLYILIEAFSFHQFLSKIIVSFVTIIINYLFCQLKIFKEEGVIHG